MTTNDQSTRTSLLKEDVTVDMLCLCARFARIRYEAESWDFPAQISILRVESQTYNIIVMSTALYCPSNSRRMEEVILLFLRLRGKEQRL